MKGSCPIKTNSDWLALTSTLGEDNAYRIFMANSEEELPEPIKAAFYLYIENQPKEAAFLLDKHIPDIKKAQFNAVKTTVFDLLNYAEDSLFTEPLYKTWLNEKGYADKLLDEKDVIIRTEEQTEKQVKILTANQKALEELVADKDQLLKDLVQSDYDINPIELQNRVRNLEFINKFAETIKLKNDRDFVVINSKDADLILNGATAPYKYNNEPVFYSNNTYYYVEDKINGQTEFYKLIIPIIGSIRKNKLQLFKNRYEQLSKVPQGQAIIEKIKKNFPSLGVDGTIFKEKVFVEAFKQYEDNKALNDSSESLKAFNIVIKDILGDLRINLRETFQPIKKNNSLENKIKPSTSLTDLMSLLSGKILKIDTEEITEDQINQDIYNRDKASEEILKASENNQTKKEIDTLIDNYIGLVAKARLEYVKNIDEYKELLLKIRDGLKYYRKDLSPKDIKAYEEISDLTKTKNLVNSLFILEPTLVKINEYLSDLNADKTRSNVEKMQEVINYKNLLQNFESFVEASKKNATAAGIPITSSLYGHLLKLDGLISNGNAIYKEIQSNSSVKFITEALKSFSDKIVNETTAEIERLKSISGSEKEKEKKLKLAQEKLEKYTFTEDKIKKFFEGEQGDSGFFTSMFESYLDNPDPIIGPFAVFLKQEMLQITTNTINNAKDFQDALRPLLDKAGISASDPTALGNLLKTLDEDKLSLLAPVFDNKGVAKQKQMREDYKNAKEEEKVAVFKENEEHLNKYFNREKKREVYEAETGLDAEANEALFEINNKLEEFRSEYPGEYEFFEQYDAYSALLAEKSRLYSIYKEDDTLKDEKGIRIAKALSKYRADTSKFYESVEKKGYFQKALDGFLNLAQNHPNNAGKKLFDINGDLTEEGQAIAKSWINQNSVISYTPEYYAQTGAIYERISELTKGLPEKYNLSKLFEKRTNILMGFKDVNGQTNPALMLTNKDKIMTELKNIQEEINEIQSELNDDTEFLTEKEKEIKINLQLAFKELSQLRFKVPTKYYIDILNYYLPAAGKPLVDEESANDYLKPEVIEPILNSFPEFKEWFDKNHVIKQYTSKYFDRNIQEYVEQEKYTYERLNAWTVAMPENQNAYKTTKIKLGKTETLLYRVPNFKYFRRELLDTYRTVPKNISEKEKNEKYVGKVIDNKGNYLPLNKEQGAPEDSPYINQDYYNLIKDDTKKQILEVCTKYLLDSQVGLERSQKLYLDFPRFPVTSTLEGIKTGKIKDRYVNKLTSVGKGIKATLSGKSREEANAESILETDFAEDNVNAQTVEEEVVDMGVALFNTIIDKVPIKGLSNIPNSEVSLNIASSLNMYAFQAEKQRVFTKVAPVAEAIKSSLENTEENLKKLNKIKKKTSVVDAVTNALMGNNTITNRLQAFTSLYNREFKGKIYDESHLDWLNKVTSTITGAASINYFALNIPSAVKNYWGALWQMNVERAAGEYLNPNPEIWAKSKARAGTALNSWTTKIWGGDYNTLDTQMILMWDMVQGKSEESLGKDFTRGMATDLANLSFMYSPRKFMEMSAGLQLFYGMLYNVKITQNINGVENEIYYADAFELNKDGKLTLLPGIDATYGITYDENGKAILGAEFKKFQGMVHAKFRDLNGTFAKFEAPQAQQYFAYRLFAFMRRYFTSMFMYRFGEERANFSLESVRSGYYRQAVASVGQMLISLGASLPYMSASEKRAIAKTAIDVGQIFLIAAVTALAFGYDDDDEDRFEKLKAKSGALGEDDFALQGFLSNQILTLLLKTQAENQSFIPLPNYGLNSYEDLVSSTSLAFGPTISSYGKLLTQVAKHAAPGEDEKLYYQQDVGPYAWQKEGEAKVWNTLGTMLGFSGSQVDPVKGLRSFDTYNRQ